MNIAVSVNKKYVRYLYVMLLSLLDTNSDHKLVIYVFHRDLEKKDREMLLTLARGYHVQITFLSVNMKEFGRLPSSEKFPLEAYYRLTVTELLPQDITKVLYMDVDIIVRSSLKDLYSINIEDKVAAVCCDMFRPALDNKRREQFKRTDGDNRYFNSGVMLFNLRRLRQEYSLEVFMEAARELQYDLQYADQEILNFLLYDKVLYLPGERYNYLVMGDAREEDLDVNTVILHFAGCNPWQSGPKNGLYRLWWKYAKKTPFYVELMEEQLWRAEGIESDGNAIGMREIEIRAIYEVAFSLKGKGLIKRWLINNHKVICIYGAGAMAEVLYELLEAEDAWCLVTGVFDRSKKGEMHGIPIENEVTRKDNAILVITPALKPNEIVKLIRKDTDWPYDIYILREFLYKVIL